MTASRPALRLILPSPPPVSSADSALLNLGRWLRADNYRFTAVTPETHRRVLAREPRAARNLRDIFGWSLPFREALLPPAPRDLLQRAGGLQRAGPLLRSTVRFSTLDELTFAHSAWPTLARDAVFFGPDTYRFTAFIRAELEARPMRALRTLVDIGCGQGAGGLIAAGICKPERLVLADIAPQALRFAAVNAALAGMPEAECVMSDVLQGVDGAPDLIVANPPYLADAQARLYRDGGGTIGIDLTLRMVRESLSRLAPGGRLLLYSGAPVKDGEDQLWRHLEPLIPERALRVRYRELDPDVFGEELEQPAYAQVERIAVVGLSVELP